ncbi:MAG: hypothetical protein IT559_02465 [Alphaproteobacteria bacterium]|nr:hypothetical protein [Alphaproteobacteria bacterium]
MKAFNTTLLRERFVIYTPQKGNKKNASTVALSNRIAAELRDSEDRVSETFIIRTHNMHSAVRMLARIIQSFDQGGPLSIRQEGYDWEEAWHLIVNDYEHTYNPDRWVAIYHNGKCIFSKGKRHPFLDMIERCDHQNNLEYDFAIPMAEKIFMETGEPLKIEYDSNVALSAHFVDNTGRLGIILRGSSRATTFTFTVQKKNDRMLNISQCLGAAAAFLEGIQLSFLVGTNTEKLSTGVIERFSKEEKQIQDGKKRLQRLQSEIENLEITSNIHYRPEKPEFHLLIHNHTL